MKKLFCVCIFLCIMILTLGGCTGAENDEFIKANRMLAGIDTYSVTAEIIVQGNRMAENYIVTQYFKYPGKYRLEVVSPDDKKGKTTVYDGNKLWIYHPLINQSFVLDDLKEVEETSIFPGYFAGNLFTGEDAEYSIANNEGRECIVIRTMLPGGNNYRKKQVLFIDRKDIKPVKMEVYDSSDNVVVTIHYRDFLYNIKLDDSLFDGESLIK